MNISKKILMLVLVFLLSFVLSGMEKAQAECIRTAHCWVRAGVTWKEKNSDNLHKKVIFLETIKADGLYGGSCKIKGRNKAKQRAMQEVKRIVKAKYASNAIAQQSAVCENSVISTELKGKYEWMQIEYIRCTMFIRNDSNYLEKFRILSASRTKFTCNGSNPVSYNQPAPPTSTPGRKEINTDRRGSDYRNFAISPPFNCDACQQACMDDPRCRAWTYVKPGVQGSRARCWLKDSVPLPVRNTDCTSGVK